MNLFIVFIIISLKREKRTHFDIVQINLTLLSVLSIFAV